MANAKGPGERDVPTLLRNVAASIEELGDVEIMDLILHNEISAQGLVPSIIVYYYPADQ